MRSRLRQEPGGLRDGSDGYDAQLDRRRDQHPELPVRRAGGYGGGSKGDNEDSLGDQLAPCRFRNFGEVLKRTASFTVTALRSNAKGFAKEFVKAYARKKFTNAKNVGWMGAGLLKTGGLFAANKAAREFGGLKTTGDFDWSVLTALDPTGISSMVTAFTKYSSCSGESFLADVNELDFGTVATPVSD